METSAAGKKVLKTAEAPPGSGEATDAVLAGVDEGKLVVVGKEEVSRPTDPGKEQQPTVALAPLWEERQRRLARDRVSKSLAVGARLHSNCLKLRRSLSSLGVTVHLTAKPVTRHGEKVQDKEKFLDDSWKDGNETRADTVNNLREMTQTARQPRTELEEVNCSMHKPSSCLGQRKQCVRTDLAESKGATEERMKAFYNRLQCFLKEVSSEPCTDLLNG